MAPFSCATPRLLRVGTIPKWTTSAVKRRVRSSASGKARLRNAAERLSLRCSRGPPEGPVPGRHINDQQVRTYMRLRTDHPQTTAAAKAGLSAASARRIDLDPRPLSAKKQRRTWGTRPDPLNGLWNEEIVPLLTAAPVLRPITNFDELARRHP